MQYKFLRSVYITLSLILSHATCIVVTKDWLNISNHPENSAPASVALFNAIPFIIAILVFLLLAKYYHLKSKNFEK